MKRIDFLQIALKIASNSQLLKKFGNKLAVRLLPKEVKTRVGSSHFVFRPKIDGLWYLNYSDAEPGVEKVLRENLKEGDTFVDIGAYIGYYSILARNIVGEKGKVIAFEPNPESYKILKKNFEINGYKNCIAENIAIADEEGLAKLFFGKYTGDSSSLFLAEEVDERRSFNVKTMTFDKYSELHGVAPDCIKIDAEGAEYKILKGMQKTIDAYHPKLLIEIHSRHLEKQGMSIRALFDFLERFDYNIWLVEEDRLRAISLEELVEWCKRGRRNKFGTLVNQVVFCGGDQEWGGSQLQ